MRTTVSWRIEERALQTRYSPIDGALAPAGHASESVLGSGTESFTIGNRTKRSGEAGD